MRVLYFHQYFGTPSGAGGTRSYEVAQRLLGRGHSVTMVTAREARRGEILNGPFRRGMRRGWVQGIDVIELDLNYSNNLNLPARSWIFAKFALRSIGLSLSQSYDVVFATSTPLTVALPGIAARWLRGKPFVFEVRDLWPELPRAMGVVKNPVVLGALSALEWSAYRSATGAVGLAPGIVEGIRRRSSPRLPVIQAPNSCDLDLFGPSAEPWRPESVGAEKFLAVFAGAHGQANGLGAVVDAAAELQRRGVDDVHILLVGDGKEKPALEQRVAQEGISTLSFMAPIPKRRLAGLLTGADIGLQVLANVPEFYYGTSPNKFFDYIASGIPVLTNYPGWVADLVEQNDCGIAVAPCDPRAFADVLVAMAGNRARIRAQGANARRLAETVFSRDSVSASIVDFLEEAVSEWLAQGRPCHER